MVFPKLLSKFNEYNIEQLAFIQIVFNEILNGDISSAKNNLMSEISKHSNWKQFLEKGFDFDNVYDLLRIYIALYATKMDKKIINEMNEIYESSRNEYRGTNKNDT